MEKSPALDNICRAIAYITEHQGGYPVRQIDSLFSQISNIRLIDDAREKFYGHDEESMKLFDWISQYHIIDALYRGTFPAPLENTPFTADEWSALEKKAEAMTEGFVEGDYLLDRIDSWLLESYALKGKCEAAPGDIVLDCGSYTGSTSVYFSQKIGPQGHVYAFEPVSDIYDKLRQNVASFDNITAINAAITSKKGPVPLCVNSYASFVGGDSGTMAYGLNIDAFMAEHKIDRVDFIKMDIEGVEAEALQGAAETIKKYSPKMALSAYHYEFDIVILPRVVSEINDKYKFTLRHFSDTFCETVLYCYIE